MTSLRALLPIAWLAGLPLACSGAEGEVVFGVTSQFRVGTQLTRLDAALLVDGELVEQRAFEGDTLGFPLEIRAKELDDGASVEVVLRAFQGGKELLERRASTQAVGGRVVLVTASLDLACATLGAPDCDAVTTCVEGTCADPFVDPSEAPDYFAGWAGAGSGDRCEPGGDPEVVVGRGQADFLDFDPGAELQVEAGPQGGYHVWIAARLKNLKQSGSLIEVTGRAPSLGIDLPSFLVAFSFDPDEGGWCKIYGLRFRLDDDDTPIESLLGQPVEITVTITDPDGDVGTSTKSAVLSATIL